jgi:hypothetical protein
MNRKCPSYWDCMDGKVLVCHCSNINQALQKSEDTCSEHGVWLCEECFDLKPIEEVK